MEYILPHTVVIVIGLESGSAGLRGNETDNQEDLEFVEGARLSWSLTEEVSWLAPAFGFCVSKVDMHNSSDPHKRLLILASSLVFTVAGSTGQHRREAATSGNFPCICFQSYGGSRMRIILTL